VLRRWLAVTGNIPEWLFSSLIIPPAIDADRRSAAARPMGVGMPVIWMSGSSWGDADPELSRRKRPITDLACLGFVSPPIHYMMVQMKRQRDGVVRVQAKCRMQNNTLHN
jgi:hypothetical protein